MFQKHCWEDFKINDHKYRFSILIIIVFLADIGYLIKLLSNHPATLSPENPQKISNFEGCGLTLVVYKKVYFDSNHYSCASYKFQKLFWMRKSPTPRLVFNVCRPRRMASAMFIINKAILFLLIMSMAQFRRKQRLKKDVVKQLTNAVKRKDGKEH